MMLRILKVLFAAIGLLVASAPAALAQQDLSNSVWIAHREWEDGEAGPWTIYFRSDGVLVYGYGGELYENGRWEQKGEDVTFHMNDHFADYEGALACDGLYGFMSNKEDNVGIWWARQMDGGQSVTGKRWEGEYQWSATEGGAMWFEFGTDGVLKYGYQGNAYDNGRWRQSGSVVTFDMNDHYADYTGTVACGEINGTMINTKGAQGIFSAARD